MVRRKAPSIVTVEHHLLRCPECGARHWLVVPVFDGLAAAAWARPHTLLCGECQGETELQKWVIEAWANRPLREA